MVDVLSFQGLRRRELRAFLWRLCMRHHRDALLDAVCGMPHPTGDETFMTHISVWCRSIARDLEARIRATASREGQEAQVMSLFHNEKAMAQAVAGVVQELCTAEAQGRRQNADRLLWNVLDQYFKGEMDRLDSFGGGSGTHQLQVLRRLDRMRRELIANRERPFSTPEVAAALLAIIVSAGMKNMPTRLETILDYLYEIDAQAFEELSDDTHHAELVASLASPEDEVGLMRCLERLDADLYQALSIRFGLGSEPSFLREEDFRNHYGYGWETLRKRVAKGLQHVRDCFLS
jgi:hypothetical protein